MQRFIGVHLGHDDTRRQVVRRQAKQMPGQMLGHLSLCFDHEAQANAVARSAGGQTDDKGSGIPNRIQPTGSVAKFGQTALSPGQMIGFFPTSSLHLLAQRGGSGGQPLRGVERLGAHLAAMVHPHQCPGQPPLIGG